MHRTRPLLGISTGDPAGIGPEITVKALSHKKIYEACKPLVVCDAAIIKQILKICGLSFEIKAIGDPAEGLYKFGTIDVLDMKNIDADKFKFNVVNEMCGKASFEYVAKVIELATTRRIDATITGPIHKEAIQQAGYNFAGHTEIYGELTNTKDYTMMLADGHFRVVHVSTHVSLMEAIKRVKKDRVLTVIQLAHNALKRIDIKNPRVAVAGLNPHAGENGLFGREEIDEIIPAINEAKNLGINAEGPFPPDTIFPKMKGGQYDVVVCMYHDQGHIPTKLLGFNYDHTSNKWEGLSGINITLGLPIIRVSVDHGVAFDKGGKGEANPESMIQAIKYGARLCSSI
jgi:4-phospho-D-threonate 3-dehydrogenase / 4-phospho-D-erythronate 3-dehydrogenase